MKKHFCPAEQSTITYQGECSWCGEKEWVGLTDEEANQLWESTDSDWELMKRTEAKLKEKNT